MTDALIVRLLPTGAVAAAEWLLVDTAGGRLSGVLSGALHEAAALTTGKRVVVLVPGTEVHTANATLPIKRGNQLEQVARYALEENLASDIDGLHFAFGKRHADGITPLAIVEHAKMQAWLAQLSDAGIAPDLVLDESDTVPESATDIVVVIDGSVVHVRHPQRASTSLDVEPMDEALRLAVDILPEATLGVTLYLSQSDFEVHAAAIESLRARVASLQVKILPEGPLPLLAMQAAHPASKHAPVNLLSGPYARKRTWNATFAPWRIAAALFGIAFLLNITVNGVQLWKLNRVEKQLDQQLREVVSQTLPGVSANDTRKARQLFQSQLDALRQGGTVAGMLTGLDVLMTSIEQVPNTRIDALAYRPKIMDLRVTAPDVDALARIQQLVNDQGLHAEIQSATPRDNKVEGRLQLKSPGA